MSRTHMMETYLKMECNFMTPKVLKYETIDNRIVELSTGFGLDNKPMWGVSEFVYKKSSLDTTKNGKCFFNPKEARAYYKLLTQ